MPIFIALALYPTHEVCEKLAELTGRHRYTRQQVGYLIKMKIPTALMIGKSYYLTEKEINWLARQTIPRKKRVLIDNRQ